MAEHSEMAGTVQHRKELSSQNQCHREMAMAERVAGADLQGPGAKQEKIWMWLPSMPRLLGYSDNSKQQNDRSQAWDMFTRCAYSIAYRNKKFHN